MQIKRLNAAIGKEKAPAGAGALFDQIYRGSGIALTVAGDPRPVAAAIAADPMPAIATTFGDRLEILNVTRHRLRWSNGSGDGRQQRCTDKPGNGDDRDTHNLLPGFAQLDLGITSSRFHRRRIISAISCAFLTHAAPSHRSDPQFSHGSGDYVASWSLRMTAWRFASGSAGLLRVTSGL